MVRKQLLALAATVGVVACVLLASCSKEEGWQTWERELIGEWATDTWDGTYAGSIVQYVFVAKDGNGGLPKYMIYGVCKDGCTVMKEAGWFGHPNDEPDNAFDFRDHLDNFGGGLRRLEG